MQQQQQMQQEQQQAQQQEADKQRAFEQVSKAQAEIQKDITVAEIRASGYGAQVQILIRIKKVIFKMQ